MSCVLRIRLLVILTLALVVGPHAFAQVSDNCPSGFTGSDRKAIKNRSASAGASYSKMNGGSIVYAKNWFDLACGWDPNLPANISTIKSTYKSKTIDGVEDQRIKLRGYLVGFKKDA